MQVPATGLTVGILREQAQGERRVALVPDGVAHLRRRGHDVVLETGAGRRAGHLDAEYVAAGASVTHRATLLEQADVVVCLQAPTGPHPLRPGSVLVGMLQPFLEPQRVRELAAAEVTALSFDTLPRTLSRAQALDALTSQSNVAGYRAALVAAAAYGGFFPMLTTAAGTQPPARVLVLGAGIAGLQAVATTRRLGADVTAFDVRASAQDDVRSLGAEVLDVGVSLPTTGGYARALRDSEQHRVMSAISSAAATFDVVIATSRTPGQRPPLLLTADGLAAMRPGSVVVDAAASEVGGNVEGSRLDGTVTTSSGVVVIGAGDLAADVPGAASRAYSSNVVALLDLLVRDGHVVLNLRDEVQAGLVITHGGHVVHRGLRALLGGAA